MVGIDRLSLALALAVALAWAPSADAAGELYTLAVTLPGAPYVEGAPVGAFSLSPRASVAALPGGSAEIMDDQGFVGGNRKLRQIWHEAGSRDLRRRFFEDEQQTFYAPNRRPYQLDHVFADSVTETRVTNWRIDIEPVTAQPSLSDHAPIWVDLA